MCVFQKNCPNWYHIRKMSGAPRLIRCKYSMPDGPTRKY